MKVWELAIGLIIALILGTGLTVGFIWLIVKVVKAAW